MPGRRWAWARCRAAFPSKSRSSSRSTPRRREPALPPRRGNRRRRPSGNRPRASAGRAFDRPLPGLLSPRAMAIAPNSFRTGPDERGHFGLFGGRYVAETLMPLIHDLEKAYNEAKADPQFQGELNYLLAQYA